MSRAYRVQWVKASRTVTAGDRMKMDVDLLDVLPQDEMRALLRAELAADAWQKQADGSFTIVIDGCEVTLAADGASLELAVENAKDVTATATSQQDAVQQAAAVAERAREGLAKEAADRLARVEPRVRERFGKSLQRAYVEGLKKKAATLGDVESVRETRNADGELELVIKVKA